MKSKVRLYGFPGPFLSRLEKDLKDQGFIVSPSESRATLLNDAIAVNAYPLQACLGENIEAALEGSRLLAESEIAQGLPVIYLSNYRVFGGGDSLTWEEQSEPEPDCELSQALNAMERQVLALPQGMVLRISWLLDGHYGLLPSLLGWLKQKKKLSYSPVARGCPTSQEDMVRVLSAMLRQIRCGIESYGIFHYCSGDVCSMLEFAQAVREHVSDRVSVPLAEIHEAEEAESVLSAVLSSGRIRDTFGIQQRSWRQGLPELLEDWVVQEASCS
ncbi:MAG: NAD(P)-dependent oxidoreductase [Cellvibrionaceae bacterium]